MDFTNGELSDNLARVDHLIDAAIQLGTPEAENPLAKEVLRAAVVFLHSSLEEVIRSLYLNRLPNVSSDHLNTVPLAGNDPSPRPKPIQLGDLRVYRGQFVENVIFDSINRFVDGLSINNATQLAQCLKVAEVPLRGKEEFFAPLESLMKRRHQIVHQMDRTNELDPLTSPINDIEVSVVRLWRAAVEGFSKALMADIPSVTNLV